jgi:deoxyribonuclease V
VEGGVAGWPASDEELIDVQHVLAREAGRVLAADPWSPPDRPVVGGCFVTYARGEEGPGQPGDRAWAAAVAWRPPLPPGPKRRPVDHHLRGMAGVSAPRRADDLLAQSVVAGSVPARYTAGLLARREGPILAAAVSALELTPDVVLVDATGLDHPRRAGLALHLGAVVGVPTVGVTHRPLVATGPLPDLHAGATSPVEVDGRCVGYWVCTRAGVRPVVAHAAWRTSPETAAQVVLAASTEAARTPVPLQEARRVAREARSLAGR